VRGGPGSAAVTGRRGSPHRLVASLAGPASGLTERVFTLAGMDGQVNVLLLENVHPDAVARLTKDGYHVRARAGALTEAELIAEIGGVHVLGIRSGTQVTERVLDAAPDLLAVGAFCIGVNQIDLAAASERGVAVFNAPFSNTRSVVELALAEIIALTRRLTDKNAQMHGGIWDKSAAGSHEVRGRRLGIVGYGNIGGQLSVLAESLGMTVVFYDTADKLALGNARRCGTLQELLEISDVVTLHVDGRPGNSGLFGAAEFAAMQPGSLFLNLSRGFVVDHGALRANIESGHLTGAAVDVFPQEPRGRGEEFTSQLRGLPNVILTPHVGGSTEEAQQDIAEFVAGKLRDFLTSGATSLSVNLPGVALPRSPGTHRLVHLHRNVPGVLATINQLLAEYSANIEGQLLGTRDDLGYVLTDIGTEYTDGMLARLSELDVTIRLRTTQPA
jgi:D-3-phosphoglycerate dehydrogenase / 2-oxoglutarate reductase